MTEPSPESLPLLLRLLEAPNFTITHATVEHCGPRGRNLLEAGLLVLAGHDSGIVDEDDGELHVVERASGRGLGYYSPTQGWTGVEQEQLLCYRPDVGTLFKILFSDRISFARQAPQPLDENDRLWDVGTAFVGTKNCSIWFARHMNDERVARELIELHDARPPRDTRIIFTSTERRKLVLPGLARGVLISISDAMSAMGPVRIDLAILEARLSGRPVEQNTSAVFLSADDRTLSINGELVLVMQGTKQRRLLRLLVDAHAKGEPIRATSMIARAGLTGHSFDKPFGDHWRILRQYMKSKGGNWSFLV